MQNTAAMQSTALYNGTAIYNGNSPGLDTLGFLIGTWQVTRTIDDRRAGIAGSFSGTAVIAGAPGADLLVPGAGARYAETGTLRYSTHTGPARRSLDVTRCDSGAVLLSFTNGLPYIELDLSTGVCERRHPCAEDTYDSTIVVRSADVMEERWLVRGPAKDYSAITVLRRLS
jgi:hypothetical protein